MVLLQVDGLPVGLNIKESGEALKEVHLWQRLFEHGSITAKGETETETSLVGKDSCELSIQDCVICQGNKVNYVSISLTTQLEYG